MSDPEPMARFNDEVQQAIAKVPAWNAGCNGYYRSPSGRIVTQWPFSMTEFTTAPPRSTGRLEVTGAVTALRTLVIRAR